MVCPPTHQPSHKTLGFCDIPFLLVNGPRGRVFFHISHERKRLRTAKTGNCLREITALSLVHQLALNARKRWRKLRGFRFLAAVLADVRFIDNVEEKEAGRRYAGLMTNIHKIRL